MLFMNNEVWKPDMKVSLLVDNPAPTTEASVSILAYTTQICTLMWHYSAWE